MVIEFNCILCSFVCVTEYKEGRVCGFVGFQVCGFVGFQVCGFVGFQVCGCQFCRLKLRCSKQNSTNAGNV